MVLRCFNFAVGSMVVAAAKEVVVATVDEEVMEEAAAAEEVAEAALSEGRRGQWAKLMRSARLEMCRLGLHRACGFSGCRRSMCCGARGSYGLIG